MGFLSEYHVDTHSMINKGYIGSESEPVSESVPLLTVGISRNRNLYLLKYRVRENTVMHTYQKHSRHAIKYSKFDTEYGLKLSNIKTTQHAFL